MVTAGYSQLTFEADALSEDGWSPPGESYRIWAQRADDTKGRCFVCCAALEGLVPNHDPGAPSPGMLARLKDRLQILVRRNRFSEPADDFQGLDLILTTADL